MTRSMTKLSAKGQIVIPAEVQKIMELEGGNVVLLRTDASVIVIEPAPSWVEETRGALATKHAQLEPNQLEAIIEATAILESFQAYGKLE